MRGRKQYELAEEVLALFYEARDKISAIRSPLGRKDETEGREEGPNETPEQKEAFDQAYVVFNRYQKHQETFNRLYALRYRFMALFKREKVAPFDELNKILTEIFIAANMLGHYWSRIRKEHLIRNHKEFDKIMANIEKYEAIFWAGFCYQKLKRHGTAAEYYSQVMKHHPNTREAELAKARREQLPAEHR